MLTVMTAVTAIVLYGDDSQDETDDDIDSASAADDDVDDYMKMEMAVIVTLLRALNIT